MFKKQKMFCLVVGSPFLLLMSVSMLALHVSLSLLPLILCISMGLISTCLWKSRGLCVGILGLLAISLWDPTLLQEIWSLCLLASIVLGWGIFLLGIEQMEDWGHQQEILSVELEQCNEQLYALSKEMAHYQKNHLIQQDLENQIALLQKQLDELHAEQWKEGSVLQTQCIHSFDENQNLIGEIQELEKITAGLLKEIAAAEVSQETPSIVQESIGKIQQASYRSQSLDSEEEKPKTRIKKRSKRSASKE